MPIPDASTLTSADVIAGLRALLTQCVPDEPDADAAIRSLDSLGLVEFIVAVERHFQLEIPDTELSDQSLGSVDALAELLVRLRGR
jgi:acyl carrier protein